MVREYLIFYGTSHNLKEFYKYLLSMGSMNSRLTLTTVL